MKVAKSALQVFKFIYTYAMGSNWRENPWLRDRSGKRAISRWRHTSSITSASGTGMISKKCFDFRVRAWMLAKLMLPVKTENPPKNKLIKI